MAFIEYPGGQFGQGGGRIGGDTIQLQSLPPTVPVGQAIGGQTYSQA